MRPHSLTQNTGNTKPWEPGFRRKYPVRYTPLIPSDFEVVEVWGFEPQTFSLRTTIGHFGKNRQWTVNVGMDCSEPA